jgi:pimeloyl-ACP methyl ester carboxylesterase
VKGLDPPALEQLQNLVVPTLIITGQYDAPDFQDIAQILHSKINHSSKKEIAGAGHMCNMEKPAVFNEILKEFLIKS